MINHKLKQSNKNFHLINMYNTNLLDSSHLAAL